MAPSPQPTQFAQFDLPKCFTPNLLHAGTHSTNEFVRSEDDINLPCTTTTTRTPSSRLSSRARTIKKTSHGAKNGLCLVSPRPVVSRRAKHGRQVDPGPGGVHGLLRRPDRGVRVHAGGGRAYPRRPRGHQTDVPPREERR